MKKAIVIGLATFLAIPAFAEEPKPVNASQKAVAGIARKPVDCVASVDAAALKAMERTGPLGQMNIYGDPVVLGPNHMRVDVDEFPGGEYAVDVMIDRNCNVLSVSTERETPE